MNILSPPIRFGLNGRPAEAQADPARRLTSVLRDDLGLTGVKVGCDAGDCGACTVLIDGAAVCACMVPAGQAAGRSVRTVEGLAPEFAALQASFLRHGAAQCGICTPGMLMAAAALLTHSPRPTPAEAEDALAGVLCRCTGYAKIIAAVCDAATPPTPPLSPGAGAAVGARIERLDGGPKVDGTERFGADRMAELELYAIRSPHHHARFSFGDLDRWRAETRAALVLTAADIPGRNTFGVIPPFADQPALAERETLFRGEAVALVAVEAGAAIDLASFPIVWTPLPHMLTPEEARAPGAPLLHPGRPGNHLTEGVVRRGDAGAALAASAHVVAGRVETSFVEHAYIEPEAGVAWMEGETLVILASTQAPMMDRDATAEILGLAKDHVRIIPAACGGGFGSKIDISLQPLIGLAALRTRRSVRMVYSRGDSMTSTTKRHPATIEAPIGATAEGDVTAMHFEGVFNTGAYASWGPTVANRVPIHATGPYRTPDVFAIGRAIHTNGPVAGAFRGFGVPQAAIMQETLYDRLAEAVGMDRLAFRLRNALRDGDATATGQVLRSAGVVECLEALQPHWTRALADAAAFNAAHEGVRRGVGVAACWYGCGNTSLPNPSTIRMGIRPDGALVLHQGATDIGQGSNTVVTQLCADALGLPVSDFSLVGGDTHLTPDAGKTSASRQTFITGKAAALAGAALRAAILRHANAGPEAALSLDGATLRVEGARAIDLTTLPADALGYVFMAEETYDPPTTPLDADGQGAPYAVYGYGAQMAELEVDLTLGAVRPLKITAAHDLGRVVNPVLAEGQIEGGVAQGLGMALMEEFIPGRTENLHDYLIPTIGDMPKVESIFIEKPDPEGPSGVKGLGEHVLIPTAPAILNAIRHATGAEMTKIPALPHRVLDAIRRVR